MYIEFNVFQHRICSNVKIREYKSTGKYNKKEEEYNYRVGVKKAKMQLKNVDVKVGED